MAVFMPITRPLRIEQRAAAVARVERGVGLDHVVDQVPGDAAQGAAQSADDAGGHGGIKAEGTADRDDQLADPQAGRFAELGVGEPGVFGLDDRDVGPGVGPDDVAVDFAAVIQANAHPARAADDVVICEQKPVGSDQKAGSRSGCAAASVSADGAEIHHGRAELLGDRHDHARVSIEGFALVCLGCRATGLGPRMLRVMHQTTAT